MSSLVQCSAVSCIPGDVQSSTAHSVKFTCVQMCGVQFSAAQLCAIECVPVIGVHLCVVQFSGMQVTVMQLTVI